MSNQCKVLEDYYKGWETGEINENLFTEDMTFKGPLAEANNRAEYIQIIEQMKQMATVENMEFKARYMNEAGDQACAIFDFTTSSPIKATTRCAETFTLENGKIKAIELIYDAREWEKAMAAMS